MKTIEQAADDYAGLTEDKYHNQSLCYSPNDIYDAFEAGAAFTQRWIPVEEGLPGIKDKSYQILVKMKPTPQGTILYRVLAVLSFESESYRNLKAQEYTHWRLIEIQ